MADALRLGQVLGNFVSNAIRFTDRGAVEVRAELLAVVAGVETLRLSVRDTGIGMTPDAQTRLFEPFERQLQTLGMRVRTATDGDKALALWRHETFAMLVTDCNRPGMDGYILARSIRRIEAEEGRSRMPIVACTVLPGVVAQCQAAGMDDVIAQTHRTERAAGSAVEMPAAHDAGFRHRHAGSGKRGGRGFSREFTCVSRTKTCARAKTTCTYGTITGARH